MVTVRPYRATDAPACFAIFTAAVHRGAQAFYSAEERAAWAPLKDMPQDWPDRLAQPVTLIAAVGGAPAGFMSLGRDGHIDLAYVTPEVMGRGVAAALYDALLGEARALGMTLLETEASHLARRFFEKHGWQVTARQSVIRRGVAITNFRMECQIG